MKLWHVDRRRQRRRSVVIAVSAGAAIATLLLGAAIWVAYSLLGLVANAAPQVAGAMNMDAPAIVRWLEELLPGAANFLQAWFARLLSWLR